MIKIHPVGTKIVSIAVLSSILLVSLTAMYTSIFVFGPVAISVVVLLVLTFRFFRIPKRNLIVDPDLILSPADGTVVAIEEIEENEYFQNNRIQVSIFMSIHNVHINWYPISGTISYFKYHPGKYLLARHPKSSELNERTSVVVKNNKSEILVRQIAGYVARRIICVAVPGKEIEQSDEMGFIRFGSRLDVFLPLGSELKVKIGDKTKGGVTPLSSLV